ncbi:unnamed protein product [Caenorhabditis bovis]|uniref:3-oxo-5-alpha-steroid 4-dehydrogenase C-terminal domain-containing protein n=1 Tax=Caenorhabditis bovis TaxID=2654633 RepID=A0A8S1EHC2_9PELO|nr:unnamed protein product [Caenorhabditis bovis]
MNAAFFEQSWWMVFLGGILGIVSIMMPLPYGRYAPNVWWSISPNVAWVLQGLPSVLVPLYYCFESDTDLGLIFNVIFVYHYLKRIFSYAAQLNSGHYVPIPVFLISTYFSYYNSMLQASYNAMFQPNMEMLPFSRWFTLVGGVCLVVVGHLITMNAECYLLDLRKRDNTAYYIPRSALFETISCPNYLGEIIEWTGYAIATQSVPAAAFAIFTIFLLVPRAYTHHDFYVTKFRSYPKDRKALIPYIF